MKPKTYKITTLHYDEAMKEIGTPEAPKLKQVYWYAAIHCLETARALAVGCSEECGRPLKLFAGEPGIFVLDKLASGADASKLSWQQWAHRFQVAEHLSLGEDTRTPTFRRNPNKDTKGLKKRPKPKYPTRKQLLSGNMPTFEECMSRSPRRKSKRKGKR